MAARETARTYARTVASRTHFLFVFAAIFLFLSAENVGPLLVTALATLDRNTVELPSSFSMSK